MADLLLSLGLKRGRDDGAPSSSAPSASTTSASTTAPLPPLSVGFGRGRRVTNMLLSGGGGGGGGGGINAALPSSSPQDGAKAAGASFSSSPSPAVDLLEQLGFGTSFTEEAADEQHVRKVRDALWLDLHNNSLFTSLFSNGAPQYDPLNDPFLAIKSAERPMLVDERALAEKLGRLHHPLPTLAGSLLATEVPPPPIQLPKTPDELKRERKARAAAKREAHIAKVKEGKVEEQQKLRMRNLETTLKAEYEADILGTEAKVFAQMEERRNAHNDTNYQRHIAALPHQIEKREDRLLTKAERSPLINVYRIFPIRERASLGSFVEKANDQRLRGFILWIDHRDALVVLMGGLVPMRHLDRWLTQDMQWRSSADTVCNRVFSTRAEEMERFSFHEKKGGGGAAAATDGKVDGPEEGAGGGGGGEETEAEKAHAALQPVYMKELPTVALAEEFFYKTMPTKGPWPSLGFLWRAAMTNVPTNE